MFPWFHFEVAIFSRIHNRSLIFSRILLFAKSLSINWKHFENSLWTNYSYRVLTVDLLYFSRIYNELIITYANSIRIHFRFPEFTSNSLSSLRHHSGSNIFLANWSLIHYLFHNDFEKSNWYHYSFSEFTIFSRIHCFFEKSLWILFFKFTMI